jgi:L-fuconolactonase
VTPSRADAIVDAHHHLWDPGRRSYPFLSTPEHAPIRRRFGPAELASTVIPHGVVQTVAVQAAPDLAETEQLLDIAGAEPLIAGVVGWIDFAAPDSEGQLDRLLAHRHGRLLCGIRAMAQDQPDPGWLAGAAVKRAAAAIADRGLVCELLIRPPQAAAAQTLIDELPGVKFVVDHAAKPDIAAGELEPWGTAIRRLADSPHVSCKVSGLITEADWRAWSTAQIAPFVDVVAHAFGEERLLFGSDWPVCLLAGGYGEVLGVTRDTLGALDTSKVFAANARRIYRLEEPARSTRPIDWASGA